MFLLIVHLLESFLPDPFMSGVVPFSFFLLNFLGEIFLLDMVYHCRHHKVNLLRDLGLGYFTIIRS